MLICTSIFHLPCEIPYEWALVHVPKSRAAQAHTLHLHVLSPDDTWSSPAKPALSNPSDSADGMSYLAREEKVRCCFNEQDDSNWTISSSSKSKYSIFHGCFLKPSAIRSWKSWVPIPCLDHITTVQVVWKYFSHKGIDEIFLDWNLTINFLRPFLSKFGFTG